MYKFRIVLPLILSGLVGLLLMGTGGCASSPPADLIARDDHHGLAVWYRQEALRLRSKADDMRHMIRRYDDPSYRLSPKETKSELIAHCETFIKYYILAAEEAETLATLHLQADKSIP